MPKLEDEDGIDGPFERAIDKAIKKDTQKRQTIAIVRAAGVLQPPVQPPREDDATGYRTTIYRQERLFGEPGWTYECLYNGRVVFEGWTRGSKRDAESEVRRGIANREALRSLVKEAS